MKNYLWSSTRLIAILLIASVPTQAQKPSRVPFPVQTNRLPTQYQGHEIVSLYQSLKEKTPSKGTYEAQAQYEKRLITLQNQPLFGTVGIDSPIAIVAKPSWFDYDPENGKSQSYFAVERKQGEKAEWHQLITQMRKNASYGIKFVNFATLPFKPTGDDKFSMVFSRSVRNDQAQQYEKNLRVAYVGYCAETPRSEAISAYLGSGDPQLHFLRFVNLRVKTIVFFDEKTGTVYGRYNIR